MSSGKATRRSPEQWIRVSGSRAWLRVAGLTLTLVLLGGLMDAWEAPLWHAVKQRQPELQLTRMQDALGEGLVMGVLGGFRTVVADFLWLEVNRAWQKHEPVRLEAMLDLTTSIDPRPELFWTDGTRMLGLDMPIWEMKRRGGYLAIPELVRQRINVFYARKALAFVDRGLAFHPDSAELMVDKARIYIVRLNDLERAALWYRRAAAGQGALPYVPRTAAGLMHRIGKTDEAVAFLREQLEKIPPEEKLRRSLVESKLQALEAELQTPEAEGLLFP